MIGTETCVNARVVSDELALCCRNYNGPQRTSPEHKTSSQRNYSRGPYSPAYEYEDDSKYIMDRGRSKTNYERDADDSEQVNVPVVYLIVVLLHTGRFRIRDHFAEVIFAVRHR